MESGQDVFSLLKRLRAVPLVGALSVSWAHSSAADQAAHLPPRLRADTCKLPEYPPKSEKAHETGRVSLRFSVSTEGRASSGAVVSSSGFARLDRVALETLARCSFSPARDAQGLLIPASATVEFAWTLPDIPNPWHGMTFEGRRFPETKDFLAVLRDGRTAAEPALRDRVLADMVGRAKARVGCLSVEGWSVHTAPDRRRVSLLTTGDAPKSEVQELWSLDQCEARLAYIVTLRWFSDGQSMYHLSPVAMPQLRITN